MAMLKAPEKTVSPFAAFPLTFSVECETGCKCVYIRQCTVNMDVKGVL
jgi:hypothetical protein